MSNLPSKDTEPTPEWGPKMLALPTERQRRFVAALFDEDAPDKGKGLLIWAVEQAGYGNADGTTSSKCLSVTASRLAHDPAVRAAIREYERVAIHLLTPRAVRAIRNAIRDPRHKDHMRANAMVLDRVDPVENSHTVRIEDARQTAPSPEVTEKVLARIEELMVRAGLAPKPAPVIDGDFEVIGEALP